MSEAVSKCLADNRAAKDAAWKAAVRKWSQDDMSDLTKTTLNVEAMLYAATDLILALEAIIEASNPQPQQEAA